MIDELPIDLDERRKLLKSKGFNISEALLARTFVITDSPIFTLNNAFLSCAFTIGEPSFEGNEIYVIYKQEGNRLRGVVVPSNILGLNEIRERQIEKLLNG